MFRKTMAIGASITFLFCSIVPVHAQFDLQFTVNSTGFTPAQLTVLQDSLADAETLWENVINGYQPGISVTGISVTVQQGSTFADTLVQSSTTEASYTVPTSARVRINPGVIDVFGSWDGSGPDNPDPNFLGLNYVDDILAHEVGHALGIGTVWIANGVYAGGTFQYTGNYGLAAYRQEFDPNAAFLPVEDAGSSGTMNTHWDQIMRSSFQEGDPSDPWNLDPRLGITDALGRDLANELMTGALDPDYGQPFMSYTTIQSLRDLGYAVVPEPASVWLLAIGLIGLCHRRRG